MAKTIPIANVPPDIDPYITKAVYNPLSVDFTHTIAGREVTIPAGEAALMPAPYAEHMAIHLADKLLRDRVNDFLFKKFTGLSESGIEKWKLQTKVYVHQEDKRMVADQLLMDPEQAFAKDRAPIDVPVRAAEEKVDVLESKDGGRPASGSDVAADVRARAEAAGDVKVGSIKVEPPAQQPEDGDAEDEDENDEEEVSRPKRRRK